MTTSSHILLAGGGSTAHLYTGLAITQRLPGVTITFAGNGQAVERHLVRTAAYHYFGVPAQAAAHNPLQALRFLTDNVAGFWASRWTLREQRVSLVIGLGGSASHVVGKAARWQGIRSCCWNRTPFQAARRVHWPTAPKEYVAPLSSCVPISR